MFIGQLESAPVHQVAWVLPRQLFTDLHASKVEGLCRAGVAAVIQAQFIIDCENDLPRIFRNIPFAKVTRVAALWLEPPRPRGASEPDTPGSRSPSIAA